MEVVTCFTISMFLLVLLLIVWLFLGDYFRFVITYTIEGDGYEYQVAVFSLNIFYAEKKFKENIEKNKSGLRFKSIRSL